MKDDDLIAQFDQVLEIKGVSLQTRKRYRSCLTHLFSYLGVSPNEIARVTVAQLRSYMGTVQARHQADSTVARHVTMVKAFFRYAVEEGYLQTNPADRLPKPKVHYRLPRALSPEEVRTLFAVIAQGQSEADRRNLVIYHLCYVCGLRIREAAGLRRQDIDLEGATLRIIGKGNKERLLFLKPKTVELLKGHIAGNGTRDFMFPRADGGHVSLKTLRFEFRTYVEAGGLNQRITAHALRHSVAVHYLLGGAPISFVQQLLGHVSLSTTGIYTRLTDAMTKKVALGTPSAIDHHEREAEPKAQVLKEALQFYGSEPKKWEAWLETALGGPL